MSQKKAILIIMDGWGLGKVASADAIQNARTPFTSALYSQYPHTTLITCGEAVGLPDGQMGNSEVGHLNLGAGKVVYQELQRINVAVRDGTFAKNETLLQSVRYAKANGKPLHLFGLVSNGGVHSHINHLKAIIDVCNDEGLKDVFIHAFTDGRDCDPKSGIHFMTELQAHLNNRVGKIATVSGRYYAMDRDKRWERIQLAYDAMANGIGNKSTDALAAIEASYQANITDEFIKPTVILDEGQQPLAMIRDGDVALCFNFRTDRCREISQVLTQEDHPLNGMKKRLLHYTTMTEYDQTYHNVHIIFEQDNLNNTIGEIIQKNGLTQLRIAETEKYPHVTFFFSGGREQPFTGEKRIMIPSPKVATYDLQPEMSAGELTAAVVKEVSRTSATDPAPDFVCLNYANADMVGHTGVWTAAIKAVETVDTCVQQVVTAALKNDYVIFLTADHGNSDYMINGDGSPNTAHTLNPVPLFIIDKEWRGTVSPGKLGDIAPTILTFMKLGIPPEMTGRILVERR